MFAVWKPIEKPLFRYPVSIFRRQIGAGRYVLITAPVPRNERQMRRLRGVLMPFTGKTVPPRGMERLCPVEIYSSGAFENRVLLRVFLELCRAERPVAAAVYNSQNIRQTYYFALSEWVERLYIVGQEDEFSLCRALLAYNGTTLLYTDRPPAGAAILNLTRRPTDASGTGGFCCDRRVFQNADDFPLFFHRDFSSADRLVLAAAMQEQWDSEALPAAFSQAAERVVRRQAFFARRG